MSTHMAESPLDLLRGELESTSRQAQLALESYLQNAGDKASLVSVARYFHQIGGALVMLEEEEVAAVATEIVALIGALERDKMPAPAPARDVLLRAVLQMPQYLEWLHHRGSGQYLNVAPLLRQLRAARSDLMPSAETTPRPAGRRQVNELAGRLRPALQRALLGILRGQNLNDNLDRIKGIFVRFKETAPNERGYRFWWLAESLVAELRQGGLAPSQDIHFLLRDLDNQIRLLQEVDAVAYDDVVQKSLSHRISEYLSSSPGGAKRIQERIDYRPPSAVSRLTDDIEAIAPPDVETLLQIAAYLKEDLALIRDIVDRFERSGSFEADKLRGELDKLHGVANVLRFLNMDVPAGVIDRQLTTLKRQAVGGEEVTGEQLFDLATELILIEDSLDSIDNFIVSKELATPVADRLDNADPMSVLRKAQLQRARLLVTHETIALMKEARERVTAHIEGGGDPGVWHDLQPALHKIGGALAMLDCSRAAVLMHHLEGVVRSLAHEGAKQDKVVNTFAEALVTVEYYLYLMAGGRKPEEDILDHAETPLSILRETPSPSMEEAEAAEEAQTPPQISLIEEPEAEIAAVEEVEPAAPVIDQEFVEVFREEAREELAHIRENLSALRQNLDDKAVLTNIRRSFHTLKGSGRMVGETALGELAWTFENLLNSILDGTVRLTTALVDAVDEAQIVMRSLVGEAPALGDEMNRIAELTGRVDHWLRAEAPLEAEVSIAGEEETAAEAEKPTPIEAEPVPAEPIPAGVDPELVELFTVEAAEILDSSDTILQNWNADQENSSLLNELRREMHTLKGSARMVGFMAIGNLAHAMESLLDAVATGEIPVSAGAVDALQRSLDSLNTLVAQIQTGVQVQPPESLIRQLHALLSAGEAIAEPEAAEAAPAAEAVSQEEPGPGQDLVDVFLAEAVEILNASDVTLHRWNADPENLELLNDLRREMHTLKGSSRMTGFMAIGNLAHAMESLLDGMATGSIKLSPVILEALQRAQDALHTMVTQAQHGEKISAPEDLINDLNDLAGIAAKPAQPVAPVVAPRAVAAKPTERPAPAAEETIRVSATLLNTLVNQMGESSICRARIDQRVGVLGFNLHELDQTVARLRELLRRLEIETEAQILFRYEEGVTDYREDFDPLELDRFSELQQLSRALMETVDDLVNIKNTLEDQSQEIGFLLDQQGKINKEIQQGLMQTRMVRFNTIIPRLRRVVRQACQEVGKRAELVLEGSESEIDRGILENIVAPLEHLLRNSLTHGIETPEQRQKVGKPEVGAITIALRREGAELVLTVRDDGAGLNFDAIRAKGQSLGFLQSGQPATEQELIALLLRPGFSTANQVTQLAGRGVGMDVVNDAVKAMRGALNIQSRRGKGVEFTIRLPFSLAVTQALLVRAGSEVYAVPLLSVEAVTRLDRGQLKAYLAGETIEIEYGKHRYSLHSLGVVFGGEAPQAATIEARTPVLLFRSAESTAALQVDAVIGNQEIIVKPVVPQLHAVPGISGATILGDGRVVLVLELAALVRSLAARTEKPAEKAILQMTQQQAEEERISALVVDDSITMRKVTARFLERHNFHVATAKDGLDAIALLEQKLPDLIILDIEMPRMDGFEVLAAIRNQPRWKNLPVIMVTSRGGEKHRERAKKLGVNDYLVKPYQEEELMNSIRRVLNDHALEMLT